MIEYHDPTGDEHDHDVTPADAGAPDDRGADAFTEHAPAPLGDLTAPADAPAELHFPGDDLAAPAAEADAGPAAPFPDDAGFDRWLAADDAAAAGEGVSDGFLTPPDDEDALPSSDALVDWTLRELSEES